MKATAQIFLSYAREDEKKVENLYQKLSDAGFKPWMDKKDILPGEQWKPRIPQAIQRSDFFLVCLSANSVDKRGWIQKEIKKALDIWQEMLDSDIYLIPVRLEDCRVPERLSDFQWVNLFEEDGWTRLVEAIRVGLERRAKAIEPVIQESTPFEPHPARVKPSSLETERKAPQKAETIAKERVRRQRERELKELKAPPETLSTPKAKTLPADFPKPTTQRRLSPWNPLDHLRLLWWVLVTPQRLKAYRGAFGEKDERRVGRWLVSTLIWLPLFIPTLAIGLRILPNTEGVYSPIAYLLTFGGLVLGWVLTGLPMDEGCWGAAMAAVVAAGVASSAAGNLAGFVAGVIAIIVAFVVAGCVMGDVTMLAFGVVVGVAGAVALSGEGEYVGVADVVMGIAALIVTGIAAGGVALVVALFVEESWKTGRPSWLARGAFGALVLAHAFLVWFSFLGGWRVFQ